MMKKRFLLLLIPLPLLVFLMTHAPDQNREPFMVGDSVPELRFKDVSGNDYFFNDFKGKVVLINHWATWCQYCLVELPHLEQFQSEFDSEDLKIVTLLHDAENLDLAKEIIQNYELTLPVLLADDNPLFDAVESVGLPYSILLDRKGKVRFIHRGFAPADIEKYRGELKYLLDEK